MALFSRTRSSKPILDRCRKDEFTQLRRKYSTWYHAFEKQNGSRVWLEGREMVMLSSNDYLGLTDDPRVIEAGRNALSEWGSTTSGARVSNGSRAFHEQFESELAAFLHKEACQIHSAGYLSCMSGACFAQKGDIILVDKNAHSSIMDGLRLSAAAIERFSHNNPADLRDILSDLDADAPKMLALEGVYSMEGHIACLPELLDIGDEYGCLSVVDDAHGFGVLGDGGRGTANHLRVEERVDIITGSFSKALSSTGGFVAGSQALIDFLRTHSKQTIFSAGISPAQTACARESLRILREEPEWREKLWKNVERYRQVLNELELDTWGSETPAIPIVLGSRERAYLFWKHLLSKGVFTVLAIAPAVPPGKDLVRTAISARHTEEDFERIADALASAKKEISRWGV